MASPSAVTRTPSRRVRSFDQSDQNRLNTSWKAWKPSSSADKNKNISLLVPAPVLLVKVLADVPVLVITNTLAAVMMLHVPIL